MAVNTYKLMGGLDPVKETANIIDQGGALMKRAETRGLQSANQRGLMNSSMAVGAAQNEVLDVAMPLATAKVNMRSAQGAKVNDHVMGLQALYNDRYNSIMANTKLNGKARKKQIKGAKKTLNASIRLAEKLFNTDIDWKFK